MLGLPVADRDQFKAWSDDIAASLTSLAAPDIGERIAGANRSQREMAGYFARLVEERRRSPRDDLLSGLVAAEEQGDKLSLDELLATCILLLAAGHETTTNLIGNGLLALLRHPEQLEVLRDNSALAPLAVEELLRYDSPVSSPGAC